MKLKHCPQTSLESALSRPRLIEQCLEGTPGSARLTLLLAPAGFGKTTLLGDLRQRLAGEGWPTVWVNCEARDRSVPVFLRSLAQAFVDAGLDVPACLRNNADIVRGLPAITGRACIFVDEYEESSDPLLDDLLEQFARSLPPDMRMFVAARSLPPLRFAGLQLDGYVRVVNATDLRFTEAEAHQFLDPFYPVAQVRETIAQADGWAFVLQLARLNGKGRRSGAETSANSGACRLRAADFLASEVMSCLDTDLRDFIIQTSLLNTVTVRDAEALTQRPDCAALLARLRPLVPIVELQDNPVAARFHPLFHDYLREALQVRPRPEIVNLHRRLAGHYSQTGRLIEAVECALGAGLQDLACELVEQAGAVRYVMAEGVSQARYLLQLLPRDRVNKRLRLRLLNIGSLATHDQSWRVPHELAALTAELAAGRYADELDEVARVDLEVVHSIVAFTNVEHGLTRPDWARLRADTARTRIDSRIDQRLRVVPIATEIMLLLRQGSTLEAAPLIEDYIQFTTRDNNFRGGLDAVLYKAFLGLARGDLEQAAATAQQVLASCVSCDGHEESHQSYLAHTILGQVAWLRNDLRTAIGHFERLGHTFAPNSFEVYTSLFVHRAVCYAATGRLDDALECLDSGLVLARDRHLPHLRLFALAIRCDLESSQGDAGGIARPAGLEELADAWRQNGSDGSLPWITRVSLARALVSRFIEKGRPADGVEIARRLVQTCGDSDQRLINARSHLVLGRALLAAGVAAEAKQAIARALILTQNSGATQIFLEQGREVVAVVRQYTTEVHGPLCDWARRIVSRTSPLELLTPRQKAVLRELANGGSTKEIARKLNLSPETVKCHLKVIYDRLGTSSREAAARTMHEAEAVL
jgi:LuxR family transcriptional regulator, maltose regulon positive regulatory protein